MSNLSQDYIHGCSDQEQRRLIDQANYWKEKLILKDINYTSGERLLEIGCGVGAVLGILGTAVPGLELAGIDLQAKQINYARRYLASLGLADADLQVGNAAQLPWQDNSFDRLYSIWFLEHLSDTQPVLQEAYRVLKPGGTITLTETDYRSFLIAPDFEDYRYLQAALAELFLASGGNPYIGKSLGIYLTDAGFNAVQNLPLAFHFSNAENPQELRDFIHYVDSWLAPIIIQMVDKLGKNHQRLLFGLNWFRSLTENPDAAVTVVINRASGRK